MEKALITLSRRVLFRSPARFTIFGFAALITVGTAFLMLPAASAIGNLKFVDALFTAVSSSCVTGLIVVDTGSALSKFGQLVVLGLIQIGGLGIMTMSTLFLLLGGGRPSLVGRMVIQDTFTGGGEQSVPDIIWDVVLFTVVIEGIGAALIFFRFLPGKTVGETLFVLIMLMFIGASPGSCGGGIKTSAFASLVILGISRLRGHDRPQIFHRTISAASIAKAMSVVMVSTVVIGIATMAILMTELGETPHPLSRGKFLELMFEVVSAFGTVGLSTGVTEGLSQTGKLILSFVMFIGRLGPLVIVLAVSRRDAPHYYYAEEEIMSG